MPTQASDSPLSPRHITELAAATAALGEPGFYPALKQLCQGLCAADSLVLVAFSRQQQPQLLWEYTRDGLIDRGASMDNYLGGAYLLDPYYQAWQSGQASGLYQLGEIAPDDFGHSAYFHQYYQYANFGDELGLLWRQGEDHCVHLSLASAAGFSTRAQGQLRALEPLLLALLQQHWQQLERAQHRPPSSMHQQLQRAFAEFGGSVLTQREGEVARLLLHGHSSKSMAQRLGISQETIKGHKRNLYQKLDISTQAELFSLFLGALSLVGSDSQGDPLLAYHKPTL